MTITTTPHTQPSDPPMSRTACLTITGEALAHDARGFTDARQTKPSSCALIVHVLDTLEAQARAALGPGWWTETDCGPCMRLVRLDSGKVAAAGIWVYPDDVGLPRYCDDYAAALRLVFPRALESVASARPLGDRGLVVVGSIVTPRTVPGLELSPTDYRSDLDPPGRSLRGLARVATVVDHVIDWTADPDLGGYAWARRVGLEVEDAPGVWTFSGWASAGALDIVSS
jgi:hypothetical protein